VCSFQRLEIVSAASQRSSTVVSEVRLSASALAWLGRISPVDQPLHLRGRCAVRDLDSKIACLRPARRVRHAPPLRRTGPARVRRSFRDERRRRVRRQPGLFTLREAQTPRTRRARAGSAADGRVPGCALAMCTMTNPGACMMNDSRGLAIANESLLASSPTGSRIEPRAASGPYSPLGSTYLRRSISSALARAAALPTWGMNKLTHPNLGYYYQHSPN
jgi:hypothetical protein